jgi:transcriptional regulator with XRE-family HTH domain
MSGDENAAGARIARARRRRGLSQAVLAGLVGRSESWLSQVERGKRGVDSYAVLTRMAEVRHRRRRPRLPGNRERLPRPRTARHVRFRLRLHLHPRH